MEYENCAAGEKTLFGLTSPTVGLIIVMIIVLIAVISMRGKSEHFGDRNEEILAAVEVTIKEKGTIMDFKNAVKDPKFPPTKYIHLADKYRQGKLTKDEVAKIMSDASI
jgi:hypothetical protein